MTWGKGCRECPWWSKPIPGCQGDPHILTCMARACIRALPCWDGTRGWPRSARGHSPALSAEMFEAMSIWINVGSETLGDSSDCFIKIQGPNWALLNCAHMNNLTYFEHQTWIHKFSVSVKRSPLFGGQNLLYVNLCCFFSLLTSKFPIPPKSMERWILAPSIFRSGCKDLSTWRKRSGISTLK